MSEKTFFITTPIYYVNDVPHFGHAYTTVAADALARYQRLRGRDVFFLTGTDEHGQKVAKAAAERGQTPQQYVDVISGAFKRMWERLHVKYDRFIRTSEPEHMALVQKVFARLREQGDISLGEYEGWYCTPCETFLLESELVDGNCPDCGRQVERLKQEAYFLRTSAWGERIRQYIVDHPEFVRPESSRQETLGFIDQGLRDACVTRRALEWDIPVPGDEKHTIYVWFDALLNYLTAAGYLSDEATFARRWPADVQLMGKEILPRFHATTWPAVLMALGLPLPRMLFANGWLLTEDGDKMSKSAGNVVDPVVLAERIARIAGGDADLCADAVRYYLLREISFGQDGRFVSEAVVKRYNADLANDLGNLWHRSAPLLKRYCDGVVPRAEQPTELGAAVAEAAGGLEEQMANLRYREALQDIWAVIRRGNEYIDRRAPWNLAKSGDRPALHTVFYDLCDCLFGLTALLHPFMPAVAERLRGELGVADRAVSWDDCRGGAYPAGTRIAPGKPLFPRIDMKDFAAAAAVVGEPSEGRPAARSVASDEKGVREEAMADTKLISFHEFEKLDLRVGEVLEAEKVPGADKLLKLKVDIGDEQRTMVAGVAEQFAPEELIGKKLVVVANLEPATIRGVESNGMILAATEGRTALALVTVDRDCPNGSPVH